MKRTSLTEHGKYFMDKDPSFSPQGDGDILFKYIREGSNFRDSSDAVIEILRRFGINERMEMAQIIKILETVQDSNVTYIDLNRKRINKIIGIGEDSIGEDIEPKPVSPKSDWVSKVQDALILPIFNLIKRIEHSRSTKD